MITATYEAYGVGELGGAFRYTGGNLRLYQNPGKFEYATDRGIYGANLGRLIGDVHVSGGGGKLDASGIVAQGEMSALSARIFRGDLESGYFFRGDGSDLAQVDNLTFVLSVATTFMAAQPMAVNEIACEFAGFKGPGCDGTDFRNIPDEHYFLASNGQLKLSEVPEPGSLALFGVALFAAAAVRRRSPALKA
jgi:hypothetical protein